MPGSVNPAETEVTHNVAFAAELLRNGQLVAFPTETVYGLGADAKNSDSVAGIFEAKRRPEFDPLIVHVPDMESAIQLATEFPEPAQRLAERFWPGPLTLVLPKRSFISDLVTAGLPRVGVRVPSHPVALELLKLAQCPVAAPSANPFSGISPTSAQHVLDGLSGRIRAVLDGGCCEVGVESTVVGFDGGLPVILRPGGLPVEMIREVVGDVRFAAPDATQDDAAQPAPGMLSRHYAPSTILSLLEVTDTATPNAGLRCGLLTWGTCQYLPGFDGVERLDDDGDLRKCATHFFAALRRLDSADLDVIIAHKFPDEGLGVALNDRLRRAATR